MADLYSRFADLAAHERRGVDYEIEIEPRNSGVAVIAPHGGKIEPMTTELARLTAGLDFPYYSLVGIKESGNHDLHITSHNFDEPQCLKLISGCDIVVAIHGRRDGEDKTTIYLGGRDNELIRRVSDDLQGVGFRTRIIENGPLAGTCETNICNRGRRKMGIQLELPRSLRDRLRSDTQLRDRFVNSVRL